MGIAAEADELGNSVAVTRQDSMAIWSASRTVGGRMLDDWLPFERFKKASLFSH
jgi:hypothetical protein